MILGHFIQRVSKESVIDGVGHIKRYYIPRKQLISSNNPLITNGLKNIKKHSDSTKTYTIANTEIKTFIAASSLAHLLDGWMYLSNSFNALLAGDEATAIHLAYYAELRSAMSILATEGIGVFDKKHFGLITPATSEVFKYPSKKANKGATHQFVWNAMEKWSNSAFKPNADILKAFTVRGLDFYELTEFFHPTTAGSTFLTISTIKEWLKDWCFDIKTYRADRETRNNVSYRPQRIDKFDEFIDFENIINELSSFWKIISPSTTDRFSLLDTYLLKKLYNTIYGRLSPAEPLSDLIDNAFQQKGRYDASTSRLLNGNPLSYPMIFQYAQIKKTTALSIISRATLLLRVSIGLVSQIYKTANVTKNDLDFVWDNYGIDNGFWSQGNQPLDFNKLWTDVEPSFTDLTDDITVRGINNDMFSIRERNTPSIIQLSQINRACLWGLNF
jgi:hypothetical protein